MIYMGASQTFTLMFRRMERKSCKLPQRETKQMEADSDEEDRERGFACSLEKLE